MMESKTVPLYIQYVEEMKYFQDTPHDRIYELNSWQLTAGDITIFLQVVRQRFKVLMGLLVQIPEPSESYVWAFDDSDV